MRKACLLTILIGLTAWGSIVVAQVKGTLTGTLLDPSGAVISSAIVRLRWNDLGDETSWDGVKRGHKTPRKKEVDVYTDTVGRFSCGSASWSLGRFRVSRWFCSDLYCRVDRAGEDDGGGTPLSSGRADNT